MPETSETIRETLQFLVASDIPSKHKRVLIDALVQALRSAEDQVLAKVNRPPAPEWQADEEQIMSDYLQGKKAKSWQHADEHVMHLATRLHRSPAEVREKAAAMGAGLAVDYRLAKAHAAAQAS
jgi:hypothetical protein